MAVAVHELELPELDIIGTERSQALVEVAAARRRHWLARTPVGYAVTTYEDAVSVLRDRRFHSALSLLPQQASPEVGEVWARRNRSILTMEGDEHARLRRLVAPAFTPAAVESLRGVMAQVMGSLVDALDGRGQAELVSEICNPYPVPVICELLGAPKEDWQMFSAWATDIFRIFNQDLDTDMPLIARAADELDAYVRDMIERRRSTPGPDLLSALIAVEEAGDKLTTDEMVMLAQAVLMAGTDTTRNQLACSLALLADHPDQWSRLAERPELASRAVEESMRFLGAVRATGRVASEDIEYRGVRFPQGTLVAISLAGGNRDPSVFEAPDTFDTAAERSVQQLTFGSGIHHCLGAALARAELQEALALLARRLPELTVDGEVEWKPATFGIWGPARLPARWNAAGAPGATSSG